MFNNKKKNTKKQKPKIVGNINKTTLLNKIKNIPIFLLIGLILMIIIIMFIYFIFLYYAPEIILPYSGQAIQGKQMVQNLKSNNIEEIDRYIDLVEVKEQELVYKKLNSYYIGRKNKTEIDLNYPIYINELNTILNLSKDTKLITVNYQEVEGYPKFVLTGGIMYNGDDLTRADGNEYLFLKTDEDIYTNVAKIEIQTEYNTYVIEEKSNIYFTEESISYYELKGTYLQYHNIANIDRQSKIIINGEVLTYEEFLEKLEKAESEKNQTQEDKEIENSNIQEEKNTKEEKENENKSEKEEASSTSQEEWVKPVVTCSDFEEQVYSIKTELQIIDKSQVITKGIVFEFRKDGKLNRKMQIISSGIIDMLGLEPDTEYEITGIFYYADKYGNEQTEEFYKGTVHTKSLGILGTIKLNFENGDIYSNKVEIKNIKIENQLTEEVVKGIAKITVEIDRIKYSLSTGDISKLKNGEEITYQTAQNVKSNQNIKYEIKVYDKYENELKVENNSGKTRTSKAEPKVTIKQTKQNIVEVGLSLNLTNKDKVKLENYRYIITNQSGNTIKEDSLKESNNTLTFTDLDPNDYYKIELYANYDLEDGKGIKQNQKIGTGTFVTLPVASLGYLRAKYTRKRSNPK